MPRKKEPDFTHTPLFVRTGLTPKRTAPTGVMLTKAGAAVLAFLRVHSSTTTKELARQIGMPHGTLRKVLSCQTQPRRTRSPSTPMLLHLFDDALCVQVSHDAANRPQIEELLEHIAHARAR